MSSIDQSPTALVTGANRGIGLETCRQLAERGYTVLLAARNQEKGEQAAQSLGTLPGAIHVVTLDVSNPASIQAVASSVEQSFGKLDVLVNNAGMMGSSHGMPSVEQKEMEEVLTTNFYGPLLLTQALLFLLKKSAAGRIINLSSGMGGLTEMGGGYASYRISKVALNGFTKALSQDLSGTNVSVFSVCPGWVRTEMGGPSATRGVDKGAETIVWLATTNEGQTGTFYRDKQPIAW